MSHPETPARTRPEQGFTLLEVLIAVALLSVAFVAILGAVGAMVSAGVQNRTAGATEVSVRNISESLKEGPWVPCDAGAQTSYQTFVNDDVPADWTVTIVSIQVWNKDNPATFTNCPVADTGVQRIVVEVSSANTSLSAPFTRRLVVVKRDPA